MRTHAKGGRARRGAAAAGACLLLALLAAPGCLPQSPLETKGALVTGALLTFARAVGEFGSTILVSGNLAARTQTAPLYIFAKFNERQIEAANAVAVVLALFSFVIFSVLFFARERLEDN